MGRILEVCPGGCGRRNVALCARGVCGRCYGRLPDVAAHRAAVKQGAIQAIRRDPARPQVAFPTQPSAICQAGAARLRPLRAHRHGPEPPHPNPRPQPHPTGQPAARRRQGRGPPPLQGGLTMSTIILFMPPLDPDARVPRSFTITLMVLLALYLGAWAHEGFHSVQNAAAGEGLSTPIFFPFFDLDCPAFGPHGFPVLGCTEDATCEWPNFNCEVIPYVGQALATAGYIAVMLSIRPRGRRRRRGGKHRVTVPPNEEDA